MDLGPAFGLLDLRPGDRLAVLEGTTDLHVALHRTARRLEVALAPLHLRLPAEGLATQLRECGERSLVAGLAHAAAWRRLEAPGALLDARGGVVELRRADDGTKEPGPRPGQGNDAAPAPTGPTADRPSSDDPVRMVLATSGTTGRPRWMSLTEGMLAAHARASARRLGLGDVWLACLPLHHVGGVALVDRCLRSGAGLVLQDGFDAQAVAAALDRVTHISLVPTQLRRLLELEAGPGALRCVLLGGDRAPRELVDEALERGWPVHVSYGLTEACGQVATALPQEWPLRPGTVGRPLEGVQVRVLDDAGSALGPGEEGLLEVSGPTVAGGGVRTGDRGLLDEEGFLFVTGREAERIVSGGENVDASEVETVLCSHPAVGDACVVGIPDARWGQRVAAAVVWREAVPWEALEAHARARLGGHQVPRAWKALAQVPRTETGKARRSLVLETWDQATPE